MKMSTKGRYALRVMCDLARCPAGEPVALRDVAQRQGLSIKYLEQIVTPLLRAGLLKSYRGTQGGYMLTKQPAAYTAREILEATQGSLAPVVCLDETENPCQRKDQCETLSLWGGLYDVITAYLDGITLDALAKNQVPAFQLVTQGPQGA